MVRTTTITPLLSSNQEEKEDGGLWRMKSEGEGDNSLWMTELPDQMRKVPLSSLAIPGSHDSLTYNLTK